MRPLQQAVSARWRFWLLAAALSCVSTAQADEAPPEATDKQPAPVTATADRRDRSDGTGEESPREGISPLGFELPPMLEELIDRMGDELRNGADAAESAAAAESSTAQRTERATARPTTAEAATPAPEGDPETADQTPIDPEPDVRGADALASENGAEDDAATNEEASDSDAALVDAQAVDTVEADDSDEATASTADHAGTTQGATGTNADNQVEAIVDSEPGPIPGGPDDPKLWGPPPPDPAANEFGAVPISLLGSEIKPGNRERLHWTTGQSFSGSVMETPVVVVHGQRRGPRLCLTGGVHGDELNGIEVVRRLAYRVEPQALAGTVIAVPIVNLLGFSRGSRYLPDRRDLNRFFPGSLHGSSASRIANSFFESIIIHCDALVDVHTGSLDRANLPQVRGDLTNPAVLEFTRGFGATAVLHSPGSMGMLRHAASVRGIPSVTFEIGAPLRLQPEEIEHGVQAIETLLNKMGMIEQRRRWREPQAVFYESRWVRVDHGGMLFSDVALGDRVQRGQRLGRVIDPVSNRAADVVSNDAGRIIGMALNQLVLPGFAAYNLGIAASEEQVVTEAALDAAPDDERFLENDQLDEDQRLLEDGDRVPDESMENARRREGDGGRH